MIYSENFYEYQSLQRCWCPQVEERQELGKHFNFSCFYWIFQTGETFFSLDPPRTVNLIFSYSTFCP